MAHKLISTARYSAIALATLVCALFAFVQIQQHLLRHRAEQLFNDIQAFQLHPSNFADLQKFQQRWGSHADYEGKCDITHCIYDVELTDSVDEFVHPNRESYREQFSWLARIYELIGGHADGIIATVRLDGDHLWGTEYDFTHYSSYGFLREFICFSPHLFPHGLIQSDQLRKGYAITRASNMGEVLFLHISAQTDPRDFKRLTALKFDCMTRIKPCVLASDIMPEVANDPFRGRDLDDNTLHYLFDCDAPTALFAREAENVAEIVVLDVHPDTNTYEVPQPDEARVRVLRKLKNAKPQAISSEWEVHLDDENLAPQSTSSPAVRSLIAGQRYLILFTQPFPGQEPGHLYLEPCSAYPATDAVFSEINKGIAMDTSGGGPWE